MAAKQAARAKSRPRKKAMAQSARAAVGKTQALVKSELLDGVIDWGTRRAVTIRKTFMAAPVLVSVVAASVAAALGWLVARR